MRYVRYAIWGLLAIILVSMSLANRGDLELHLFAEPIAEFLGWDPLLTLPIFVWILGSVGIGLFVGFFWEWFRETKHRREANRKTREVRKLEREVSKLKTEKNKDKDEVLAILDDAG